MVGALVTTERDGDTEDVIAVRDTKAAPIGSAFKLYVLAAVADEIEAGAIAWDDTLTLTAETRSLPSGTLQDQPDGTEVTVRQAAEQMIAISDNTATDLLIGLVGRERVEQAVVDLGHATPDRMRPLLTTREMFQLSYGPSGTGSAAELATLSDAWADGSEAERRTVLDRVATIPLSLTIDELTGAMAKTTEPAWTRDLEWFASPADLAAAHRGLAERAERLPELSEILGKNPGQGLAFDRKVWPDIAFKGGGNTGVTSLSWRAIRADGLVLTAVLTVAAENADDLAAMNRAQRDVFSLAEDIFRLAGDTP